MVLSLIYGRKYPQSSIGGSSSTVGTVTFDTMLTEEHRFTSRITSYPVERGTIISDHILNLPNTIVLSGYVTDTPLTLFAPFNRSIDAFNRLIQMHEQREVIEVVTGLRVYQNMAIVSMDVPRNMKTGQTLTFNIELQQINFSDVINLPLSQGNIFAGSQTVRSNEIISSNSNIPILQNDPQNSLKDQASTQVNTGIQSTDAIPTSILSVIQSMQTAILGSL
jgi:hypothetical protein